MAMRTALLYALLALSMLTGGCGGALVPPLPPQAESGLKQARRLVAKGKLQEARRAAQSVQKGHANDWSVHLAVFQMWAGSLRYAEAGETGLSIVDGRSRMNQPRTLSRREVAAVALMVSQALWSSGRTREVERVLDVAIRSDPQNAGAANELAYHLAEEERDLPKALRLARAAVSLAPREGYIADTLGWVYYKMGNTAQARHWLAHAVKLDPNNAELRAHLSRVELSGGQLPSAYVEMRKALALSPGLPEARTLRAEIIRRYNPVGPL